MAYSGDPGAIFDWPWFGLTEDVRPRARARLADGAQIALATLVSARGSSPRPVGSRMLIDSEGVPEGYVSGGCVEAAVAGFALEAMAAGAPRLITLGAGSAYVDVRLPCGGAIDLYIEPLAPNDPIVAPWLAAEARREAGLWLADLASGARAFIGPHDAPPSDLHEAAALALTNAMPALRVGAAFFRREEPRLRLIVIGGDPVALALLRIAQSMGVETHLVRDAGPSSGPPGVSYAAEEPGVALPRLGVDCWTAVITTTHDLERDAAAITAALAANALYVGALGSKRRAPERAEALRATGLDDGEIARLRSPIGLEIGAASPFEIALATFADIIAARRGAR